FFETVFYLASTVTFFYVILLRYKVIGVLSSEYSFFHKLSIDLKVLRKVGRFASGMLLISLVAGLNSQMDKLTISKILPITVLGFYTLAVSLTSSLNILVSPISVAFLPRLTALFSEHKTEEAFTLYKKIFLLTSILVFSVGVCLVFYREEVLFVWTGNLEIAKASSKFIPFLIGGAVFLALSIIPYNLAIANGYTRLNNILGILSLTVTLPGYWIMTNIYGAIGAALVWGTVQFLIFPIYLIQIHKRYFFDVKTTNFVWRMIIIPLLISCLTTGFLSLFLSNISGRWMILLWICFTVLFSLSVNTLFLVK
ncbi:hypothetical protein DXA67_23470, partial [Bacteroides fragilis]